MQGEDADWKEDVFGTFLVINAQHMPTWPAPHAIEIRYLDELERSAWNIMPRVF
jgi:hypothetical protein